MVAIMHMWKILMFITSVRVKIRTFIVLLKGNNMGLLKFNKGGSHGQVQDSNIYKFCQTHFEEQYQDPKEINNDWKLYMHSHASNIYNFC